VLVIWRNGSAFAVRSGMMNGNQAASLREPIAQQWERFLEPDQRALSLAPVISLSVAASAWPNASRIVQRRSDATQSTPPTGI